MSRSDIVAEPNVYLPKIAENVCFKFQKSLVTVHTFNPRVDQAESIMLWLVRGMQRSTVDMASSKKDRGRSTQSCANEGPKATIIEKLLRMLK